MNGYGEHYRGEGYQLAPDCVLPAHFIELQAFTDALGHAAQLNMSESIVRESELRVELSALPRRSRRRHDIESRLRAAELDRERFYAHWLAYGWVLRSVEGNTSEMDDTQRVMLERIDWSNVQRPVFRFPGYEAFAGVRQHLPGEEVEAEVVGA